MEANGTFIPSEVQVAQIKTTEGLLLALLSAFGPTLVKMMDAHHEHDLKFNSVALEDATLRRDEQRLRTEEVGLRLAEYKKDLAARAKPE